MSGPTDNETWLIETGDAIIRKKARGGMESLLPLEKLVYCFWVADYGMRNAGDLDTAEELFARFQSDGRRIAGELSLRLTHEAFSLAKENFEQEYFNRFEAICEEIKGAGALWDTSFSPAP